MIPEWQTGIVIRIEQAAPKTRRFWIQLPKAEKFLFKPGQFLTLDLPIHEQRNKRWRSYSIASAPDEGNVVELVIVHLELGLGSTYFFEEIKTGSELTLRGPHGMFTLPEQLEETLFLLCTGTGIAPFRSMLLYLQNKSRPYKEIHLLMGTRTKADLLYHDEMVEFTKTLPRFYYHPTLSREVWNGRTGYIHTIYEELCKDLPTAQFMLCGWRNMVDEARQKLAAMGYDKKAIHLELYG